MDRIIFSGLRYYGFHGLKEEERKFGQPFVIDAELELKLERAGMSDGSTGFFDYTAAYTAISETVEKTSFSLMEALAEALARRLLEFPEIWAAKVTVKKPEPPLKGTFDHVGVTIRREKEKHLVYVGLGSNLGDRKRNICRALEMLHDSPLVEVVRSSPILETEPEGVKDQPWFLNCVAELWTIAQPLELVRLCHEIELKLGRERTVRWGPRTVDVDVLLFGHKIISTGELVVPHPRLKERLFVLIPLYTLRPDLVLPTGESVADLIKNLAPFRSRILPYRG